MKTRQFMSAIIAAILSLSIAASANTENFNFDEINEIQSYGIMPEESFDEYVSRGEMAYVSLGLQGIDGSIKTGISPFADVSADYQYAGAISAAKDMGILGGYPDGNFYPASHVTLYQAVKIITVSLGYEPYAQAMGGYPHGYIAAANKIKLLASLKSADDRELTRNELALMLSDALDAYPMEKTYGSEESYVRGSYSVREILANRKGTVKIEGVVVDNGMTALGGSTTVDKNQVKINNAVYNADNTNIADCLGMNVTVFADNETNRFTPVITHFYVNSDEQKEKIFDADDVAYVAKGMLKVYEEGKEKTYRLKDDASYIYNGKSETPTRGLLEIFDGSYRIVDYDANGVYDVLFITEKESFVVEKTYNENIYFSQNRKFRGANGVNLEEDDDSFIEIYAPDSSLTDTKTIEAGMGITFVCSNDKKVIKAYLSNGKVSGNVSEINADEKIIYIDGTPYRLATDSSGTVVAEFKLGVEYNYTLNCDGKIIGDTSDSESEYEYAYVISSVSGGTFTNSAVQLIGAGSRKSETKTSSGTTTVSHKVQNGEIFTLELANKVDFNESKIDEEKISPTELVGRIVAYKLGADGKIRVLRTYDLNDGLSSLKLNTDIFAFGGFLGARNFVVGDATKLICVPEKPKTDEDYSVLVTLKDDVIYDVCPVEIDPETMTAEAVVLVTNMDSQTPASIDSDVMASIVGKVSAVVDEDEMPCYKVQILTGDKIAEVLTNGDSSRAAITAESLSTGDVIRYSVNALGRIDNIEVLASLYNTNEYFRTNPNTLREKVFGQCYEIKRHRLSEGLNEYVDQITLRTGETSYANYEVRCTDGAPFYIFERKRGTVMHATSDDVLDFVNISDEASDVYMFVKDAEPQVVVIVKE